MTDLTPEGIELLAKRLGKTMLYLEDGDPTYIGEEAATTLRALASRAAPAPTDNAALVEKLSQRALAIRSLRKQTKTDIYDAELDEAAAAALSSRAAAPTPAPVVEPVEGAPERIWASFNAGGSIALTRLNKSEAKSDTWHSMSGPHEYVRADLTTPPEDVVKEPGCVECGGPLSLPHDCVCFPCRSAALDKHKESL